MSTVGTGDFRLKNYLHFFPYSGDDFPLGSILKYNDRVVGVSWKNGVYHSPGMNDGHLIFTGQGDDADLALVICLIIFSIGKIQAGQPQSPVKVSIDTDGVPYVLRDAV